MKATILAYGATSSGLMLPEMQQRRTRQERILFFIPGKTYTMSGLDQTDGSREQSVREGFDPGAQEGLIPRAMRYVPRNSK